MKKLDALVLLALAMFPTNAELKSTMSTANVRFDMSFPGECEQREAGWAPAVVDFHQQRKRAALSDQRGFEYAAGVWHRRGWMAAGRNEDGGPERVWLSGPQSEPG